MEKTINIGSKEVRLKSSLFTIIEYRNIFGVELFTDIKKMDNVVEVDAGIVIDVLFKIIYVLNKPFNNISYEKFLMDIDFSILSDQGQLEDISNVIGSMLGGGSKKDIPK